MTCESCDDTGEIMVATFRKRGTMYLVTRPVQVQNLTTAKAPCACKFGVEAQGRQVFSWISAGNRKRMFAARVTASEFAALRHRCRALWEARDR